MTTSDLHMIRVLTEDMTKQEKFQFQSLYQQRKKSTGVALLLALFFGGVGIHNFYLGNTTAGVLFLLFFWTFVPLIISLIQCFFIGNEVKGVNQRIARDIAAEIEAFR